jgi:hypothetical protein
VAPKKQLPERVSMMIRFPPDVRSWLERQSARSFATMNAEVVRSVTERMQRDQADARGKRTSERA